MKFETNLLTYIGEAQSKDPNDKKPLSSAAPTEKNIHINAVDEAGKTLLHTAIEQAQPTLVDACIEKGATVYERDYQLAVGMNLWMISKALEVRSRKGDWDKDLAAVLEARKSAAQVVTSPAPFFFIGTATGVNNNQPSTDQNFTKPNIIIGK